MTGLNGGSHPGLKGGGHPGLNGGGHPGLDGGAPPQPLPTDPDAEQYVLGAMLRNNSAVAPLVKILGGPAVFSNALHQRIYALLTAEIARGSRRIAPRCAST